MSICPRKRFVRIGAKKSCDRFQTSYERSYYYQSPNPWSLQKQQNNVRFKTDFEIKPITVEESLERYMSSYNKDYKLKLIDDRSETYRRSSIAARPTLKNLCEKFKKNPIRPLTHSTTTGSTYVRRIIPFESWTLLQTSPTDDATCPIVNTGKNEFPTIPLNEFGFYKHLDPLVSTTKMTHINFTSNKRTNNVGKNIIDKKSKCHHFLPKIIHEKGPLPFIRCTPNPPLIYPKKLCVIPYKGYTTTYKTHYDYILTNLIPYHVVAKFPTVFKLSRNDVYKTPSMYRTEQCHVGTGLPIRAAINLGPIKMHPRPSARIQTSTCNFNYRNTCSSKNC